jgi:hypothetical protein
MNGRLILCLIGYMVAHPAAAQTVTACSGQLIPLKPASLISCSTAAPVCISDTNGLNGHWIWGCPVPAPPAVQLDPTIPLRGAQPHIMTPAEIMMEAEQIRALRLQNQLIQQQLDAQQQLSTPAVAPGASVPPPPEVPPPDGTNWKAMKDFERSMILWHTIKSKGKFEKQTEKAMDRFYSDPANLSVPISDAFLKVSVSVK